MRRGCCRKSSVVAESSTHFFIAHLFAQVRLDDRWVVLHLGGCAFADLLTIEDGVFIGAFARITLHEYRVDEFRAGRVLIRKGAFIGGSALIGCGIEIGEGATVAAGAGVGRDVPPGATAIGNPARIVLKQESQRAEEEKGTEPA